MSETPPPFNPTPSSASKVLRWGLVIFFLLGEFILIGLGIRGAIPNSDIREVDAYSPWSKGVIEVAANIPVQDGGRIKPLLTYARFKMMTFHGSLTMKVKSGGTVHKIGPVEWYLDCLFRPELADDLPIFRVDDAEILRPFGIETEKRRARLSFNDIMAGGDGEKDGFALLRNGGAELLEKQKSAGEDALTKKEKKIVDFAQLVLNYTAIRDSLDILRGGLPPLDPTQLAYVDQEIYELLDSRLDPALFSFWLPILTDTYNSTQRLDTDEAREYEFELNRQLTFARFGPAWIPPQEGEDAEWQSIGTKVEKFLKGELTNSVEILQDMQVLESLNEAAKRPNGEEFLTKLTDWRDDLNARAEGRGEGEKIDSEVSYYKRNYFMYGLVFFVLAFLVSAVGWLVRDGRSGRVMTWLTAAVYGIGVVYVVGGIIHRYIITGRPPVSNLYDTIPFITAGAVIILAIAELLTRRKVLLSLGAALGAAGLFFAFSFELGDAKDNMDPLRAVLDSNYWLATHVVTVTIGYCGGLVACFLSIVYVHLALAGVMNDPKSFHRFMTRAVYGITCFTLLFALVGTILGGIWANDSWGRFWGWDPKENGALLIVLWSLIILHARLAGWMKGIGLHVMSILGGSVVVFSWWGVNMLGVGLHSYGFTEGASTVYYFYYVTLVATGVGFTNLILEKTGFSRKA
ncbi:MAG: ABC-type transport system involved in cytochrome c biogenesis permease subunit [Akkermansiaceae bacterium]